MPYTDWQFWVVTLAMIWGFVTLVRQLWPRREGPACGNCAAGAAACSRPKNPAPVSPLRVLRD